MYKLNRISQSLWYSMDYMIIDINRPSEIVGSLRRAAGLTQSEMAQRLGTAQSAVSRWERGHEEPRLSTLEAIARTCGKTLRITVDDDVDRAQIRQQLSLSPTDRLASSVNVSQTLASSRRL